MLLGLRSGPAEHPSGVGRHRIPRGIAAKEQRVVVDLLEVARPAAQHEHEHMERAPVVVAGIDLCIAARNLGNQISQDLTSLEANLRHHVAVPTLLDQEEAALLRKRERDVDTARVLLPRELVPGLVHALRAVDFELLFVFHGISLQFL